VTIGHPWNYQEYVAHSKRVIRTHELIVPVIHLGMGTIGFYMKPPIIADG